MMRRAYRNAIVEAVEDGYGILLDAKPLMTPLKSRLIVTRETLAAVIAGEWNAQGDVIAPHSMPLTQLATTAQDRVSPHRAKIMAELLEYAATDLVCYRASEPEELVAGQSARFDPLLEWFEERTGSALQVVRGLMPVRQDTSAMAQVRALLEQKSTEVLTALSVMAPLASSLVIALALAEAQLTAAEAYEAAFVDEIHQVRKWGEDEEAVARLNHVRGECDNIERYLLLLA